MALYRREARTVDHVAQVVGQQRGRLHSERMHIDIRAGLARLERHAQQLRPHRLCRRTQLDRLGNQRTQRGRPRLRLVPRAAHPRRAADGVRERPDAGVPAGLPEIDAPLDDQGARALDAALVLLNALPADLHAQVAEVSAPTRDAVRMTLRDGVVVEWGSSEEAALKVRVLQTLRAVPENAGVTVYDVSAPRLPVTR